MIKNAVIDSSGQYRYLLTRAWDQNLPRVVFIMLNGSTADGENDDPTLRRCIGFAKQWGFGSLEVVNLFGYRTTFPTGLKATSMPVGPENDWYVLMAAKMAQTIIVAWGVHGQYMDRNKAMVRLLREHGFTIKCLGTTKDGHPKHPLYLKGDTQPQDYNPPWEKEE